MAALGGGYNTRTRGLSTRYSAEVSPRKLPDDPFLYTTRDLQQVRGFPTFTLKKSYWQKTRSLGRTKGPLKSIYASMPVIFVKTAPQGRPKPAPLPHKDLISLHSHTDYNSLSKVRRTRKEPTSEELWRPTVPPLPPSEQEKDWTIEACRNMYLTFDPSVHAYGLRYKDEVKDGFQNKVLGYLEAHRSVQASPSVQETRKKPGKGRLRLHPPSPNHTYPASTLPVTPVIKAMPIE